MHCKRIGKYLIGLEKQKTKKEVETQNIDRLGEVPKRKIKNKRPRRKKKYFDLPKDSGRLVLINIFRPIIGGIDYFNEVMIIEGDDKDTKTERWLDYETYMQQILLYLIKLKQREPMRRVRYKNSKLVGNEEGEPVGEIAMIRIPKNILEMRK